MRIHIPMKNDSTFKFVAAIIIAGVLVALGSSASTVNEPSTPPADTTSVHSGQ